MTARPVVIYDANVLYPAQLRDLLMRLAVAGLVRAHWTDRIHEEWIRNVLSNHSDLSRDQLEYTRTLMERALPAARVQGYERHISSLELPDPDDRHVVAAAIEAEADVIVTFNLSDFPPDALEPHGLRTLHPDIFVLTLFGAYPDQVIQVMRTHRTSLRRPPRSPEEYLSTLERAGLNRLAAAFRASLFDQL